MSLIDIKDRTPNQDLIDMLTKKLGQAKTGELRSCLFIFSDLEDAVNHHWALDPRNSHRRLLAEMVMAQHNLVVNIGFMEGDSVLAEAFADE